MAEIAGVSTPVTAPVDHSAGSGEDGDSRALQLRAALSQEFAARGIPLSVEVDRSTSPSALSISAPLASGPIGSRSRRVVVGPEPIAEQVRAVLRWLRDSGWDQLVVGAPGGGATRMIWCAPD